MIPALIVFLCTYAVVALGRLPGLRVDRAGAALIGASLMVGFGVLSLEEAYRAIDLNTIVLLVGMMILVANLKLAGFFGLAARWVAERARHPLSLLAGVTLVSGALSAFLVNDTVCLMLTPLVAELALGLRRNPVPYLLSLAMASNIGSTATITGNPQNILIGSFSGIPYTLFASALAGGGARTRGPAGAGRPGLSGRVPGAEPPRGTGAPRARPSGAARQGRHRSARHDRGVLRGRAAGGSRDHRRCAPAVDPPSQARAGLSRDRLGAPAAVRGTLRGGARHGAGVADARGVARR